LDFRDQVTPQNRDDVVVSAPPSPSIERRSWMAQYTDASGKRRTIGYFDTQEDAARAYNAAIRRAGLEGRRRTNPVVDGRLVPRARKADGYGEKALRKRRREETAAAAPSPARRPRRD